jgi:hypothetical protein
MAHSMALRNEMRNKSSGGIHIKPSHEGLLHKKLGVPEGKKIGMGALLAAKNSGNEKTRKQAQFAINAKKWKH